MALGMRGPYRKIRSIGKGAFGAAFIVQRGSEPKQFVMKEVPLRGLPPKEVAAAQNEVSALKRLQHDHVVGYEEALVVDQTLCIVMEHCAGGDLAALLAKRKKESRPLSEAEVVKLFWQITSALAYCHHDHRMLHRDLKPANIFLTADGDAKLGDFGLAKVVEATCALNKTQCGTPVYMSPELCNGQNYNRAADVWALGCVLFELMTLNAPWADMRFNAAGGMSALLKRIANSTLDLTPCRKRYSEELCSLLSQLLHKRGACRPALNNVLLLEVMERAAPTPASPPPSEERPLPPSWRKVPSQSRPGEFSYLHLPTGFKQAFFPESDDPSADILESARKLQQARSSAAAPPPSAQPTPMAARVRPAAPPAAAPAAAPAPSPAAVGPTSPAAKAPSSAADEAPTYVKLPPSWRKVPSSSRPGEFSYLHVASGYKQVDVPKSDTPDADRFAMWKKQNPTVGGQPPPTPAAPAAAPVDRRLNRFGPLEPVLEASDAANSPAPKGKGSPPLPPVKRPPADRGAPPAPGLRRIFTPQTPLQKPSPAYYQPRAGDPARPAIFAGARGRY